MKLTNRTVEALPPGPEGGRWYADDETRGLVLVAYPKRRAWGVRYTVRGLGRRRFTALGDFPVLTSEKARKRATEILGAAAGGHDPVQEREDAAKAVRRASAIPRFGEAVENYLDEIQKKRKRPDAIQWNLKWARSRFERDRLDEITIQDVSALHHSMRKTPTKANRVLMTLSGFFTWARRAGRVKAANPCQGIEPFEEAPPRDRILSDAELDRLVEAVEEERDDHAHAAFRLMLETACRVGEVLAARWEHLNLEENRWRLPSPKAKREQWIPLLPSTSAWLKALPRRGAYVVAGKPTGAVPGVVKKDPRRFDLKRPWERIRKRARLVGVTLHDVRRSVLSRVANAQGPLVAQRLGRHADLRTTVRHYLPQEEAAIRAGLAAAVLPFVKTGTKR
jgi:integrase